MSGYSSLGSGYEQAISLAGGLRATKKGVKLDTDSALLAAQKSAQQNLASVGRTKIVGFASERAPPQFVQSGSTLDSSAESVSGRLQQAAQMIRSMLPAYKTGFEQTLEYDRNGSIRLSQTAVQAMSTALGNWLRKNKQSLRDASGKGRLVSQRLISAYLKSTGRGPISYYPILQFIIAYNKLNQAMKNLYKFQVEGDSYVPRKLAQASTRRLNAPVYKVSGLIKKLGLPKNVSITELQDAKLDADNDAQDKMNQFLDKYKEKIDDSNAKLRNILKAQKTEGKIKMESESEFKQVIALPEEKLTASQLQSTTKEEQGDMTRAEIAQAVKKHSTMGENAEMEAVLEWVDEYLQKVGGFAKKFPKKQVAQQVIAYIRKGK